MTAEVKEVIKLLERHVSERQLDRHRGLEVLCDFLLDLFDYRYYTIPGGWQSHLSIQRQQEPHLFRIAMIWMERVADAMEQGRWVDFFGGLYEEMYQTKGKASSLGQFFTPIHLCDLLTHCVGDADDVRISDPACGSGRTLLAHFADSGFDHRGYYIGEDIDTMSVKMCALNLMIHGMQGRAVRHDTLREPNTFDFGYEVNEVRYPMPVPFYSVRKISCKPS